MGDGDTEAARTYHEVTKHCYTSVGRAQHLLDWDNQPLPFKIIRPQLKSI
jgi:hypothetical protein